MNLSAANPIGLSDELLFRDGLGDRLLIRGADGRPTHERLLIRPELSALPAFELALNERMSLVEKFDHPAFPTVRRTDRARAQLTSLSVSYDVIGGKRLSEYLAAAAANDQPMTAGATVFLLKEVLDALAGLHRQPGDVAHGAIAPERIVLADGKIMIADHTLGPAIEQLRFSSERYWNELRVAVPPSAGGARLDRRTDVAQAALVAVAMFAGRPLRDTEHLNGIADVLMSLVVPPPIRSWLLRALHTGSRRVFVHAGEAALALSDAMNECGLTPAPQDLDFLPGTPKIVAPVSPKRQRPVPAPPAHAAPKAPADPRIGVAANAPNREVWDGHDSDPRQYVRSQLSARPRSSVTGTARKLLTAGGMMALMTGAFTAAQFIPAPEWMFSQSGTLVIESSPQGISVLVDGTPQGVTPLRLEVAAGIHEVELHGPGKPKAFKVHVTRGDRVAQRIEFLGRR